MVLETYLLESLEFDLLTEEEPFIGGLVLQLSGVALERWTSTALESRLVNYNFGEVEVKNLFFDLVWVERGMLVIPLVQRVSWNERWYNIKWVINNWYYALLPILYTCGVVTSLLGDDLVEEIIGFRQLVSINIDWFFRSVL